ncbi:MAG: FAD-dependent oxidoreductase [Nodularia sp. (in: Bacteria)]|nr:MAG: FAD-dependent oxidoreductase [Nodularia sp. (in: cyanobacteria)]
MIIQDSSQEFDVIILGSGISGSILATILAKHQARVLMLDKSTHPRFAIGEAMTSHTESLLSVLSHQYSIPELDYLSSFPKINQNITTSCGYKRAFGFLYHHENQEQSAQERILWGVTQSSHLFRQDIDNYFANVAIKYGANLLSQTIIDTINIYQEGVEVTIKTGEKYTANYLVDASGYKSMLAEKFQLRKNPTRCTCHSRSIFTHMVGVKNIDDCLSGISNQENILPWYQGTVHHVFDGGWMWVIPFNNHENSTNPICSVGLNLDIRRFPKNGKSPEQEFQDLIAKFPSVATQFEDAQLVRDWVSTGRMQYSSHSCTGERFYILPHATGFIDPIFSVGLIQTFTTISPLAALILKAIANNDFSSQQFTALAKLQQKIFDYYDHIAHHTYIAFSNFHLMNIWLRVWLLQHTMSVAKIIWSQLLGFLIVDKDGYQEKNILQFAEIDYLNDINPMTEGWGNSYVYKAMAEIAKVEQGLISADAAAANIQSLVNSTNWLFRSCGLVNPDNRFMDVFDSPRYNFSFLAYAFWVKLFLKKEDRPFDFKFKNFIDAVRLGIKV